MTPLSLHAVAVPAYRRGLEGLAAMIGEAAAGAAALRLDPAIVLDQPIADRFPTFGQHARGACRHVDGDLSRLSGIVLGRAAPVATFAELADEAAAALRFLAALDPAAIDAAAGCEVIEEGESFSGFDFIARHSLPHFYFHIGAAALILRHHGIAVRDPSSLWQP
ncbi:MAG: DUF1993 family protein [Bauldia sp.]|nr:DUF1993 family protein [Bauldia sp.]